MGTSSYIPTYSYITNSGQQSELLQSQIMRLTFFFQYTAQLGPVTQFADHPKLGEYIDQFNDTFWQILVEKIEITFHQSKVSTNILMLFNALF